MFAVQLIGVVVVVSQTAFPLQEIDASASGNGRSVGGPCGRVVHNFINRSASRLLSLSQISEFEHPSLYFVLRLRVYVVSQPRDER